MSFIEEIKQSKAFKLTASYLGICFIALQVIDPLSERNIINESLFRAIVYLIILTVLVYFSMKKIWSRVETNV